MGRARDARVSPSAWLVAGLAAKCAVAGVAAKAGDDLKGVHGGDDRVGEHGGGQEGDLKGVAKAAGDNLKGEHGDDLKGEHGDDLKGVRGCKACGDLKAFEGSFGSSGAGQWRRPNYDIEPRRGGYTQTELDVIRLAKEDLARAPRRF